MENVGKILEDLNSVIDGGPAPVEPAGELVMEDTEKFTGEWTNTTTMLLLAKVMESEDLAKYDPAEVDEMLEAMLDTSLTEGKPSLTLWSDPENPSKGSVSASGTVGVKADIEREVGRVLFMHPPAPVKAAGMWGKELWGEAIAKAVNEGRILQTRYRKKDDAIIIEPGYERPMHWYKKFISQAGFVIDEKAEKRMVDQLEDQIIEAAKDLAAAAGLVDKKSKSRAGRIMASTKGRKSYKGKKANK